VSLVRESPVVVALGGNAISPPGQRNPIAAQYRRACDTATHLVHFSERPLLVTHGNGPQVGDALLRSDLAAEELPRLPLDACVAATQGDMGYMLELCLDNALRAAGVRRSVVALVTRTVVEFDDPAFLHPTKPVGSSYDEAEARQHVAADGWVVRDDAGRGWRRVVPSPEPIQIVEERAIRALLATGAVVVAAGGGGIPVVRQADGTLAGVEAVVDKDLASSLLAANIGAEVLMFLTGVEHVALDFGRPTQRDLHEVAAAELAERVGQGHFAPGSMLPKVQAALRFLERGGRRAVITTPELSEKALAGEAGTQVLP
jgi:carbamate kinase